MTEINILIVMGDKKSILSDTVQKKQDALIKLLDRIFPRFNLQEPTGPDHGGEDEANFALSWLLAEELCPSEKRRKFLDSCFVQLRDWVRNDCVKGYQPIQEAHHGTEPFLLFLPRYSRLNGVDREACRELMCGAADYILGRVPGQPQWYDEANRRFVSLDLGSERAEAKEIWKIETADHLRFIHIALSAYEISGDQAYGDWACEYAQKRAELINEWPDDENLPWGWWHDGRGIFGPVGDPRSDNLLAPHHHLEGDPLGGVENMLASGVMEAFAGAYEICRSEVIARAAKRIAKALMGEINDPYADPAALTLRTYRRAFGDSSFDEVLGEPFAKWTFEVPDQFLVLPAQRRRFDHGVGRRADMIRWYEGEDGGELTPTQQPCTSARALAYEITGDVSHLEVALELARKRMDVANRGLRSGREHADMGSSIAACGAGHGRCWGTGNVTGVLQGLIDLKTEGVQ